jgi:2-haloacid dehalogenase
MQINTIIFDVNETLLDLTPLKQSINAALENESAAEIWFAQLLHYSLVESITETYHDFSEIAAAVYKMNAEQQGRKFSQNEIKEILAPISKLQAYKDVVPGLRDLKEKGFKLVAFSNGKPEVLKEQLEFAKLDEFFDQVLSVEAVKRYKPHPDSYNYALKLLNTQPENALMVAAHGWDIAGAGRAGLKTAFIERPGKQLFPLSDKPDLKVKGIDSLAAQL